MNLLLVLLLCKENYIKHGETVRKLLRSDSARDVFNVIDVVQAKSDGDLTFDDLLVGIAGCYPEKKATTLCTFVETWRYATFSPDLINDYLNEEKRKASAYDVAIKAVAYAEGKAPYSEFMSLTTSLDEDVSQEVRNEYTSNSLLALRDVQIAKGGLIWRLNVLNALLGHIPKKTFGFIVARPDTGKTTFLCSEIMSMARQTTGTILWIANEEDAAVVKIRCFQALFGVTEAQLFSNITDYQAKWDRHIGDRLVITGDSNLNSASGISAECNRMKPDLVIIDQLDKVMGFKSDKHELMLGGIYKWARALANKQNCAVIGVTQANSQGEGKKYLHMDNIADSHTSKAAEADWILGIGKDHNEENVRYFHTMKDKLPMSEGKDPAQRHGFCSAIIRPDVARYADMATGIA